MGDSPGARALIWVMTGIVAAGPALWAAFNARPGDFASAAELLGFAGSLAGVAGLSFLLLAMVLSIRAPGFDGPFGGLLRLWRIHHRLGALCFVLLMLHPVLLSLAAAGDGPEVVLAVLAPPWGAWPVWAGWMSLLAMMIFLAPSFSFFAEPFYQRWKMVHRLSGLVVVLGLVHAIPLSRSVPAVEAAWLWGGLGALALFAFFWRLLLSRLWSRKRYRITEVRPMAPGVVELTLDGPPLDYRAGQFVYLTPRDPILTAGRGEEHPYSLSSAPQETSLRIGIKDLGDASHALQEVTPGSEALIEGPYGSFLPARHDRPALWIGGGIGITPFVSAAREFAHAAEAGDVELIYCANDPGRAYYLEVFQGVAAEQAGLRVHPHYFAAEGPLSEGFIRAKVPDYRRREVYACGPPAMLALVSRLLRQARVPQWRIHTEEFELL